MEVMPTIYRPLSQVTAPVRKRENLLTFLDLDDVITTVQ